MDNGFWTFGGHTFRSHGGPRAGRVDMHRSIVQSSNVYYYQLGNDMGVDAMHDFTKPWALGKSRASTWAMARCAACCPARRGSARSTIAPRARRWFPGETISLGIGQGYNTFTMLQLAGHRHAGQWGAPPPAPWRGDGGCGDAREPLVEPRRLRIWALPARRTWMWCATAMVGVTQGGTSTGCLRGPILGGKTGTAQAVTMGQKDRYNAARLEEHNAIIRSLLLLPAENPASPG